MGSAKEIPPAVLSYWLRYVSRRARKRLLKAASDTPRIGLEMLEPRLLLSGFSDADFSGTLALQGVHGAGSVVLDGKGHVTSSSVTDQEGSTDNSATGTYGVTPHGVVTVYVHNSSTYDGAGAANTTKDIIVENYATLPNTDTDDAGLNIIVKHSLGTFSNADVSGTWSFSGEQIHGTATFDGKGNITGGSYAVYDEDQDKTVSGKITGGTYSVISSDGAVTLSPTVDNPKYQPDDTMLGTINDSKDVMAFNDKHLGHQSNYQQGNDADLLVMVRNSGSYSNADAAGTWTLATMNAKGNIIFDGKGGLTGNVTDKDDDAITLTGTYTLSTTGLFTAHIVPSVGDTMDFTGAMDHSKNIIGLAPKSEDPDNQDIVVLVKSGSTVATQLAFDQQPTDTMAGSKISPAVTVKILDSYGDVVTTNTSAVTMAIASGPGTLGGTVTVKAVKGVATFSNLILTKVGSYTLRATDGALTAATSSSFNVIPGAATKMAFKTQPNSTQAGVYISPPVTVELKDANGNSATTDTSSVTLSIASGPTGATLDGTTTVKVAGGVATFNNLKLTKAGTYTLKATDGSLAAITSNSFAINPAAAAKVAFGQQPTNTTAGNKINPAVTVSIQDGYGNVITVDNSSSLLLSIASGPAGATFNTGLTTATAKVVKGVATFSNLVLTKAGDYVLTAVGGSLAVATSNSFTINPGPAKKLAFLQQPTSTHDVNTVISPPVTVQILDAYDNLVTTNTSAVTMAIASGTKGAVLGGTVKVAAVAGVATFSNLTLSKTGAYYTLKATDGSLTLATSVSFNIS